MLKYFSGQNYKNRQAKFGLVTMLKAERQIYFVGFSGQRLFTFGPINFS